MFNKYEIQLEVNKLLNEIKRNERLITELRKLCKHEDYEVKLYSWRLGNYEAARICLYCQDKIDGITEKERNECWKKNGR